MHDLTLVKKGRDKELARKEVEGRGKEGNEKVEKVN